ncbi:MAG: hypothetical protein IKO63_04820 [Paludibacteraceae bacterium]|nr:hypothetical protein [Paludibacteraceae bacterium]
MSILDDDVTVEKKIDEVAIKEMMRLYLTGKLPAKLTDYVVKASIEQFLQKRLTDKRYASYDFCYLYFQCNKGKLGGKNVENSCMHLWGYLASWGMLRGSSALLQCSPAIFVPLINYLDSINKSCVWDADVDTYTNDKSKILNVYDSISNILETAIGTPASVILTTKIMLGVFGCVPAFDQYFTKTFHSLYTRFYKLRKEELESIEDFYRKHKSILDSIYIPVVDFNGTQTKYNYKKAKLIDMFGFMMGQQIKP